MKEIICNLLILYKKFISKALGPKCRYVPTCSMYSLIAINRFGVIKGSLLTIWRLLRCNPFSKGGYDPVPDKKSGKAKWVL